MTIKLREDEVRTAPVDLSGYHDGQAIKIEASVSASGRNVPIGENAFGLPVYQWQPRLGTWRAHHTSHAPTGSETVVSPPLPTREEAEQWLVGRGLRLGGARLALRAS